MPQDRWPELCKLVERDDGLPTRTVGHWSEDKLFFWNRYIDITTRAMVGAKWRAGLVYVDLFAGPGVCTLRESKIRIPGSPIIAANAPKPFTKILLCEKRPKLAAACRARLEVSGAAKRFQVFEGDCNTQIKDITSAIPDRALTLAFIDPTGLHANFATISRLSQCGRVDLLILFADRHDIVRNVDLYYGQGSSSNLDKVLGPDLEWRKAWERLENRTRTNVCNLFADMYKSQLKRHLGYKRFGEETIKTARGPLYRLIYASKHDRGLEFWDKITTKDAGGQKRLPF